LIDSLACVVGVCIFVFGTKVAPLETVDGAEVADFVVGEADGVEVFARAVAIPDFDALVGEWS
jgi:hypothetical protein